MAEAVSKPNCLHNLVLPSRVDFASTERERERHILERIKGGDEIEGLKYKSESITPHKC